MKCRTDVRVLPDKDYEAWFKGVRDDRYETLLTDWSWWRRADQCSGGVAGRVADGEGCGGSAGLVLVDCVMPNVGANSLSVAFGNFGAGYLVADRGETRILRDPFSNKPFVHFYATKRVGGAIIDSQAIKLMKFAAS